MEKILEVSGVQQIEFGSKEQIFNEPRQLYTRELIAAVPRLN